MLFGNKFNEDYDMDQDVSIDESLDGVAGVGDGRIKDQQFLQECMLIDQMERMSDEEYKAYTESDEFKNLLEAGITGRRSIVKMNRQDDLSRRINLAAIQMAREKGDADWEALRRNRVQERRLLDRIYKKYSMRVRRDAIQSQKRLVKLSPNAFNFNNIGR